MALLILGAIWFVLTSVVGAVMYASQVGPREAVSNLSLWAQYLGIENPPEWLKAKSADLYIRRRAVIALMALLVFGGFLGGMAFNDFIRPSDTSPTPKYASNAWVPLNESEAFALREELKKLPPEKVSVLCAYSGCTDLADSIFQVLYGLNWAGTFEGSYLTDSGIKQGIEIWSFSTKKDVRNKVADSIERATKGRLKVSSQQWGGDVSASDSTNMINLVVGRAR